MVMDLDKMIERYIAAAETTGEHIKNAQQSIAAANLIGSQIVAHKQFRKMPAEMQEKFRASQVSAAGMLKMFDGFAQ